MQVRKSYLWIFPGLVLIAAAWWSVRYALCARRFYAAVEDASAAGAYDFLAIKTTAKEFADVGGGRSVANTVLCHDGSPYDARVGTACVEGLGSLGLNGYLLDICCARGATSVAAHAGMFLDRPSMPRLSGEDVAKIVTSLSDQPNLWPVGQHLPGYPERMNRVRHLSSLVIKDGTDQQVTQLASVFDQHPVDLRMLVNCRITWRSAVPFRDGEAARQSRIARVLEAVGVCPSHLDAAEEQMNRPLNQVAKELDKNSPPPRSSVSHAP